MRDRVRVVLRQDLFSGSNPNCKIKRFAFWRCEGCALVARNYGVPTIAHALSGDVDGLLSICLMFDAMINHSKMHYRPILLL
jgi:hypothetical protein